MKSNNPVCWPAPGSERPQPERARGLSCFLRLKSRTPQF